MAISIGPWVFKNQSYPFTHFFPQSFFSYHPKSPRQQILQEIKYSGIYSPGAHVLIGAQGCGKLFMTLNAWCDSNLNCHNFIYFDNVSMYSKYLQTIRNENLRMRDIHFLQIDNPEKISVAINLLHNTKHHTYLSISLQNFEGSLKIDRFIQGLAKSCLHVPPLKKTPEDIGQIISTFANHHTTKLNIESEAITWLQSRDWPDNFRQLINVLNYIFQQASITETASINKSFCQNLWQDLQRIRHQSFITKLLRSPGLCREIKTSQYTNILLQLENILLVKALDECDGVKRKAASVLGMPPSTLINKLDKFRMS